MTSQQRPSRPGASFAARFGRVILQHGIAPLPSALYHFQGALGLSAQQVWFVSYILAHKWDADLPYPSLKKMAERTGLSLRQIQRIKAGLCDMEYLTVGEQYGAQGGQDANTYDFVGLFARLETLLAAAPRSLNPIRGEETPGLPDETFDSDTSFVARYGRVIARYGVAAVPRALFTHQAALALTPQQVWFAAYIYSFQWDTGLPYPSLRRMAERTGYSTVQLHAIKAELVAAGYLRLVHRQGPDGNQDTNAYDFSGLLDAITARLRQETPNPARVATTPDMLAGRPPIPRRGRRRPSATRDVTQLTGGGDDKLTGPPDNLHNAADDAQLVGGNDIQLSGGDDQHLSGGNDGQLRRGNDRQLPGPDDGQLTRRTNRLAGRGMTPGYSGGMTRGYPKEEPAHEESNHEEESNPLPPHAHQRKTDGLPVAKSQYIAAVVLDFSRELGDTAHAAANVTQAWHLYTAGRCSEQEFVARLYEARRRTRQYQGAQGTGSIANKMGYFFRVLRDLGEQVTAPQRE